MIPAIGRFAEALRVEGAAVSPAELVDAVRAVETLGVEARARFKAALRATLAKDRRRRAVFDRVFDRFFASPEIPGRGREGTAKGEGPGGSHGRSGREAGARRVPPREERNAPGKPMSERESRRLVRPTPAAERRRGGAEDLLERIRSESPRPAGRLRILRASPSAEQKVGRTDARGTPRRVHRELSRAMATEEEKALADLVPRLLEEIRLRTGRRVRRSGSGRIFLRRVFRENLAHGGIPFVLPFRRKRPRRLRVVLLVDVSFSAARATGFFLWMASAFLRVGRDARVIAFVDRPVDATEAVRRWLDRRGRDSGAVPSMPGRGTRGARRLGLGIRPASSPFSAMLESLRGLNLDAPSDYGRALHAVLQGNLRPGSRDTVLVILGDGRTNRFDPLAWTLEEIARRCRAVLWLVPEPGARWGTGDSALPEYLPFADVAVEAHDLAGLARGISELLRRL